MAKISASVQLHLALILLNTALLCAASAAAQVQNDFDQDGLSDLTVLSAGSNSVLVWTVTGSDGGTTVLSEEFGLSTDKISLARWLGDAPSLGVVRKSTDNARLKWKVLTPESEIVETSLGLDGDLVIAGADFGGSTLADGATVRIVEQGLKWSIRPDMFSPSPSRRRVVIFGDAGDRALYLSTDGERDRLAAFGLGKKGAVLKSRSLLSKHIRRVAGFPKGLAEGDRPRPFPVQSPDGTDALGFVTVDETDTTVRVFSIAEPRAELLVKRTFPGIAAPVVGDYLADEDGEEILLATSVSLRAYNPFSDVVETLDPVSGTPIDEINLQ